MQRAAVIMAGGGGTRFWPVSRMTTPKQLARLTGDDVMINETIKHYDSVIGRENTFIVTNEKQAELMDKVLFDEVDRSHILIEPVQRNTAPCIIYAAMTLKKLYGDAIMAVLPADHHIGNIKEYERVLNLAMDTAEKTDRIVTVGLKPTFPSTGYGYINYSEKASEGEEVYDLLRFVEKPDLATATEYVNSGRYLWNSGMFIWKVSVILDYFKKLLPEMYADMEKIFDDLRTDKEADAIARTYPNLQKISVDYGIMEHAEGVYCIPADFGWNDVGSWDSLDNVFEGDQSGNITAGEAEQKKNFILEGCKDTVVFDAAGDKFVAAVGLENIVVVNTKDAVLVLNKDKAQDVKKIVDALKESGREDLL